MTKTGLNGYVDDFSFHYRTFDISNIIDIDKYLIKKIMFWLIQKVFIGLLTGLVNESNYTKCVSLTNQKCTTQHAIIKLHPNEYTQC